MRVLVCVLGALLLAQCAAVRTEDLQAWPGTPVATLETHPIFLTLPVVKTIASDGTEMRDYVNGSNITACSGGGTVFAGTINTASYNQFSGCMQSFAACHNIFYIKNGIVTAYTPVGTGGARCFTNETLRPGFRGATNIR